MKARASGRDSAKCRSRETIVSTLRSLLLQEIAEGHPETALLRRVLYIGLGRGLLLVRQRLLARQANAPPALLDREDEDLHLAARGEHPAMIGAAARAQLRAGHEPRLAWAETDHDAEWFHAIHRARQHGADGNGRGHLLADRCALRRQRQRDAPLGGIDVDD